MRGGPDGSQRSVRAQICAGGESVLSPEQQMECLFDLATDAAILGRAYSGWRPYL